MSLLLIRVMQIKASQNGLQMSPAVLKEELMDLREIIMIYDENNAETKISRRSSVLQRLWDLFNLGSAEESLGLYIKTKEQSTPITCRLKRQ